MSEIAAAPDGPAERYSTLLWRLAHSGQWERVLDTARDWLSEDPENCRAHLAAGQALINLERYAPAQPHLAKALQGNPQNDFAHRLASLACFHLNDFAKADDHIQQALALHPNEALHWYHLAWMRYQHGALQMAAQHARRALELRPEDANTINLLALCQGMEGPARLAQYQRALALDPENEMIHNNIGVYYMDVDRNYPAAEECFRRALMFNPSLKMAQKNLFQVLRQRDLLYRVLSFPRRLLGGLAWNRSDRGLTTRLGLLLFWVTIGRALLPVVAFWLVFIVPLMKGYEYLTLGDIRAKAGVPGARRGGIFGFRRWPFGVRFGVFVALSVLFWGGVYAVFRYHLLPDAALGIIVIAALPFLLFWLVRSLVQSWKYSRRLALAKRSEKKLQRLMNGQPPPLP
jgi:tetratricopeptide (TPR) repeat protein